MSFFKEQTARLAARKTVHESIAKSIDALLQPAQQRVAKAKKKLDAAQVEFDAAEDSLASLQRAQGCNHVFTATGDNSETCNHCGWVHYF